MKYAIISDIHGNDLALQKVLEDAYCCGADSYIFVGDYCISAPWPREVVDRIFSLKTAYYVRGNEEVYLGIPESENGQFEISRWCKHQLTEGDIDRLNELPEKICFKDGDTDIHVAHSSEIFIGDVEMTHFGPDILAERYDERVVSHREMLVGIDNMLEENEDFWRRVSLLPKGIYIFGHSHIQWHKQTQNHLFINPGSCGLPLDCGEFGAPYTLLTIDGDSVKVEERRVRYDRDELIRSVMSSSQYARARVWTELIFNEWKYCRENVCFFLQFAEVYATKIGDDRRPFEKDTWEAAHREWKIKRPMGRLCRRVACPSV